MHQEIFSHNQIQLLPLVKKFKKEFYLAGDTAIALHIGHRRSIGFDIFKLSAIRPKSIIEKISEFDFPHTITSQVTEQLNVTVNDVQFTFSQYPFKIEATENYKDILRLPALIDLAATKAFALGRTSKWKDLVDLYFILNGHITIKEISREADHLFGEQFSERLFRELLAFQEDIDFSEPVEFIGPSIAESEIKESLADKAFNLL